MANEQKELIRHEARARRASIPGQLRLKAAESLAIHLTTLLSRLPLRPGHTVGCYLAIGTEINSSPVIRTLRRAGMNIALPRTIAPSAAMEFIGWAADEPLRQDMLGFPTPASDRLAKLDALVVPLIAFDRQGGRIGQGAGFYDRTIAQMRRNHMHLPVIGLAFACQEMKGIPVEAHDQPLDYIITDSGLIEVPKELESQAISF